MKNKNLLRACAWLLTLCTAIPVLASCGGDGTTAVDTQADTASVTETAAETEPLDALEARKLVDDELGEYDFGGYEYRIVASDNKSETIWSNPRRATSSTMPYLNAMPPSRIASTQRSSSHTMSRTPTHRPS